MNNHAIRLPAVLNQLCIQTNFCLSTFLKLIGLTCTGFSLAYLCKVWHAQRLFKRLGLPTPPVRFFVGNFPEILAKTQSEAFKEWTKQLGKTYGIYEGHIPIIVTSDLEIIQEVFVKQFGNFIARKVKSII